MASQKRRLSREAMSAARRLHHQRSGPDPVVEEAVRATQGASLMAPSLTPDSVAGLQSTIGNRAVGALVARMIQRHTASQSASSTVVQRVLIAGIDVRPSGNMPTWDQGGETYHINLTTDTSHVTQEGVPKIHYFFEGAGQDITDKQPSKGERGGKSKKKVKGVKGKVRTKRVFSELPAPVQQFIRNNYLNIIAVR